MDGVRQSECAGVTASFLAVPECVPRARQRIVRLAEARGATGEALDAIRLATSEAITNVVVHAYPGAPGMVHVTACAAPDALSVTVSDDGEGLRPRLDLERLGLGLALIADAALELSIATREAGGTELQMRFALSPGS